MAEKKPASDAAKPRRKGGRLSKLLPSTVPGCAAVLTAIFLVAVVAVVWTAFFFDPAHVPWRHSIGIGRLLLVFVLLLMIPLFLYRALTLWLDGETSLYPEIDTAWSAGMEALKDQGLDIQEMAFYLIIGSRGVGQERAMMQSGQLDLRVDGVPDGPAPLHWYATPDSIYLFCSDASWSSALAAKRQRHYEEFGDPAAQRALRHPASPPPPVTPPPATPPPAAPPAAPPASLPGAGTAEQPRASQLGTVQLEQFLTPATAAASPTPQSQQDLRGTVRLDSGFVQSQSIPESETIFGDTGSEQKPITINSQEATQRIGRLTYLCQQIARAREPLCPINGILSLLPYAAIDSGTEDAAALQQAVKSDLTTIHYVLQVRCPVTALVVDLERQQGFRELMRRVGRERVSAQRFGRKYDCRSLATDSEMTALSEHVCGTFEDWVYALFREDEALTRPGNQRLYHLLCKVRCTLKDRLANLLQSAFAFDPAEGSAEDALLFSGCYFAATGERSDHRAFVGGILSKLDEEQELVEWTTEALLRQQRWERVAAVGLILSVVLAVLLVWLIFGWQP